MMASALSNKSQSRLSGLSLFICIIETFAPASFTLLFSASATFAV